MIDAIKAVDRGIFLFFRIFSLVLLCLLFVMMSLNVILRFFPVFSIGWFDEIVELSFAWMALRRPQCCGADASTRRSTLWNFFSKARDTVRCCWR